MSIVQFSGFKVRTGLRSTSNTVGPIQATIDAYPMLAFFAVTFLYVVAVVCLSHFKLLWLDELITLHIARLNGATAIWDALLQGADPNPPLTHILVHFCRAIFGERELALRLPAIIGYWLGLLSLFLYLLRRFPGTWALGGTVLSMCMASFEYSYESRSYGIFYGLAMLAFFLWSRTVDPERTTSERRNALVGMTLSLAAGISTNYFAVLAFLPIATGELVRTLQHSHYKKLSGGSGTPERPRFAFDPRIWLGIFVAATPLLLYRPMISRSIAQFAPYAWNKVSLGQVLDSYTEMVEVALYPILAFFVLGLIAHLVAIPLAKLCANCRSDIKPRWLASWIIGPSRTMFFPAHESFGILCLMAYPFLGYMVASVRGGMLSPRFVIPVCFGFAIAAVLVAFRLFAQISRAGLYFLLFWLAWFVCRGSVTGYWYSEQKQSFYKVVDHLRGAVGSVPSDAPIAIADPLFALTFQHYAPADLSRRAIFPVDFPAVRNYRHDDSPEENLWAGRNWLYSMPIVPMATVQQNTGGYLIIASDGNWLLQDLSDHHYTYRHLPIDTRAGAIGGFTPLFHHGVPSFYVTHGDRGPHFAYLQRTLPFSEKDNLPTPRSSPLN